MRPIRLTLLALATLVLTAAPLLAAGIPCSAFPPHQRQLMQAGERLDPTQDWQIRVFASPFDSDLWRDEGVEVGTRAAMVEREAVIRAGMGVMMQFELIDGYITLTVPKAWTSGDPFAYPDAPCPAQ